MESSCCFDDVLLVGDALDFFVFVKNLEILVWIFKFRGWSVSNKWDSEPSLLGDDRFVFLNLDLERRDTPRVDFLFEPVSFPLMFCWTLPRAKYEEKENMVKKEKVIMVKKWARWKGEHDEKGVDDEKVSIMSW